jgi:hypothetical protein
MYQFANSPMTRAILIIAGLLTLPQFADAQKRCTKGIPCGNTCISASKTCRIGTGTATREPPYTPPPPAVTARPEPTEPSGQVPRLTSASERDPRAWVAVEGATIYYPNQYTCEPSRTLTVSGRVYFRTEAEAQRAGYRRSEERGCH